MGTKIKLNIKNLVRSKSLYHDGMLPRICFEQNPNIIEKEHEWNHDPSVTSDVKFY